MKRVAVMLPRESQVPTEGLPALRPCLTGLGRIVISKKDRQSARMQDSGGRDSYPSWTVRPFARRHGGDYYTINLPGRLAVLPGILQGFASSILRAVFRGSCRHDRCGCPE